MKLLMISPLSSIMPSEYYAPVENQIYLVAQEMTKKHEIWISCLKGSAVPAGCNIVSVQDPDEAKAFEAYKSMLEQFDAILDFSNLKYAYLYKHEQKPDLKLYGCCYPYQSAGYQTPPPVPFPYMIGTSDAMNMAMIAKLGCMFKKVHYAPMPTPANLELGERSDANRLLFLGRLEKGKGAAVAVDLARQLRVGLDILGEDIRTSDQRYTVLLVQKADGRLVRCFGRVTENMKHEFLAKAKALIIPYVEDVSAYTCQTILEAFQYGTPVITLNKGAVNEFVQDGVTGLICKQIDDLPSAVKKLDSLSPEKCMQTAEKYSAENAANKYENLLAEDPW